MNMMKGNLERVGYISDLEKWVKRGFSTTHSTKKAVRLSQSPNLERLSKIAQQPVVIQTQV